MDDRRDPAGARPRRSFLLNSAAAVGSLWLAGGPRRILDAQGADALVAPPWDNVPTCRATNTDGAGQGPFFVHDGEHDDDVSLFREDIRGRYNADAEPGTEMQLHLRVLGAAGDSCDSHPVPGIEIYIWHTDAQGYYSGFGDPGEQQPDVRYAGVPSRNDLKNNDRFCRGVGVTDANGVVSFRSIFPGWYNGRDIHVHFMVVRPGTTSRGRETYRDDGHILTTQFYFEPELIDSVHKASEPYLRRTLLPAYEDAIKGDEPRSSGIRAKASFDGRVVVAQLQVILDPNTSGV